MDAQERAEILAKQAKYRILNADKTYLNAGTDKGSWFNLADARKTVNYDKGQIIVEHNGVDILWEIF